MMQLLQILEPKQKNFEKKRDSVSPAIGIDLGTTNSVVAVLEKGKNTPSIVANKKGLTLIPSLVAYTKRGIHVGDQAFEELKKSSQGVVKSAKRFMSQAGVKTFEVDGNLVSPVEVSAEILKSLKNQASQALKMPVTKAVITIPAYFDDSARAATKAAAHLAGLDVLRLIHEPTAAALAYGLDKSVEGLYAVYDLGGGTFDFSLLNLEKGLFKVIATGGDLALGGDDFEEALLAFLIDTHDPLRRALDKNPEEFLSVLLKVRTLKEKLSSQDWVEETFNVAGEFISVSCTRDVYEKLIEKKVSETLKIIASVLRDAEVCVEEIQGLILVGGASRTPLVRQKIKEFLKKDPLTDLNPDEVVAMGAAYQAYALTYGADTLLLDVAPLSLGIETMGGVVEKIIFRNSPIPLRQTQEFTTSKNGQQAILIHVLQGERELVKDCQSLARFELKGLPCQFAGKMRILVTFAIDVDGLLTVSAIEKSTGIHQEIDVYPTYGLSEEKIKEMLLDSMRHGEEDLRKRLLEEARLQLEQDIRILEKIFEKEDRSLFFQEKLKEILKESRKALQQENISVLKDAAQRLVSFGEEIIKNF